MSRLFRSALAAATLLAWDLVSAASLSAEPSVVATIVPIHGLVAAVMEGAGEPVLLVPQNASAHTFALRPSQAVALRDAKLVFWSGPGVEAFLSELAGDLQAGTKLIALSEAEGVERLPIREGGAFVADEHEDETHADYDAHTWLDPKNATAMVKAITVALSEADPGHATLFRQNGDRLIGEIEAREREIETKLKPFHGRRFILFHDATQYFERRFGLSAAGTMSIDPEIPPGARRIVELRALVEAHGVQCVLAEPQFDPHQIEPIVEGTNARVAMIDVEGALISPGPKAYLELLDALSNAFVECLRPST